MGVGVIAVMFRGGGGGGVEAVVMMLLLLLTSWPKYMTASADEKSNPLFRGEGGGGGGGGGGVGVEAVDMLLLLLLAFWPKYLSCCFLRNTITSKVSLVSNKSRHGSQKVLPSCLIVHRCGLPTVLPSCHLAKVVLLPFFWTWSAIWYLAEPS